MTIIDLDPRDERQVRGAARLLIAGFAVYGESPWPDWAKALAEVRESFGPDRLSRIAVDARGEVLGWIGGIPQYDGNVLEVHPLVVSPEHQRQGIGRALIADLERIASERGAHTLWLGTDDPWGLTTLSGVDLYPNVGEQIANIRNLGNHPYEFYQKVGFTVVGVMPDANGPGKPDIFMAKRVRRG